MQKEYLNQRRRKGEKRKKERFVEKPTMLWYLAPLSTGILGGLLLASMLL